MSGGPDLGWYVRRIGRMSAAEVAWRAGDRVRQIRWAGRQVRPGDRPAEPGEGSVRAATRTSRFGAGLPPGAADRVPAPARAALLEAADALLAGHWEVLGVVRDDLLDPDWFLDPVTSVRSDPSAYAFRVNHRAVSEVGDVKQVWELSRHGHLTLLAAAWACTHEAAYAERAAAHLRSWWAANPFLSGVHWTSGIEVGLRLLAWTWVRRLLADWPGAAALFEGNELARQQIRWHQEYLAAFRSRGSSANNHVVAEAAGLLVGACAFPWFPRSDRWRATAAAVLERELDRNTDDDGTNRELASEYHAFVGLLGLLAAVEADAAGHPLAESTWRRLAAVVDVAAALVDESGRPPRQGDGDDARAVLLDPPEVDGWQLLLSLGADLFGPLPWWPRTRPGATSALVGSLLPPGRARRDVPDRPRRRPDHLAGSGITLLRTRIDDPLPEIWCRCDGGPHGFLSIAGHAHADALSVEVRHAGVDVLADPGTLSYLDDPWRAYCRSTAAHNTIEVAGTDQSVSAGPFLWTRHAGTQVLRVEVEQEADLVAWSAVHDGYARLDPPVRHRRTVELDRVARVIRIEDSLDSERPCPVRIAFHLGPAVSARLEGPGAVLEWPTADGCARAALDLPGAVRWTARRGCVDPLLGWYGPRLGRRVPTTTLLGVGTVGTDTLLQTRLRFVGDEAHLAGSRGITRRPTSL